MNLCWIKLGNITEGIISIITLGNGKEIASWIAYHIFGKDDCGCEQRRIWLNKLTCNKQEGIKI